MSSYFKQKNPSPLNGFTLVEMIVVVGIFTIVMLALFQSIDLFYRYNAYAIAQAYQIDSARKGMDALIRDIREMTFADDGTFPLERMQPHIIGFYSDIDRDDSVEYVEYELSTTTILTKRVYGATGNPPVYSATPESTFILSNYVQNLNQGTSTFLYYDKSGLLATATSTVTDIVYVGAQIIVNIDPIRDPGQFMLRSAAALRNLKDNL
jgi:prepilin-type N-terminal cleavage/methylation domain-containing protein